MADAKIITFGELFSATTDVIQSNKIAALDIEDLGGESYIKINTTTGSEAILMGTGDGIDDFLGLKVGVGIDTPVAKMHLAAQDNNQSYIYFTNNETGHLEANGCYVGLNGNHEGVSLGMRVYNRDETAITFGTDNKPRMIIPGDGGVVVTSTDNTTELRIQNSEHIRANGLGLVDDDILKVFADDDNVGSDSAIVFHIDGSEQVRIDANGDVGIGITDPSANLHVTKGAGTPTNLAEVDTQSIIKVQARTDLTDTLHFCNNSAMILQGSDGTGDSTTPKNISLQPFGGYVGIGTNSPTAQFHIQKDAGDAVALLQCDDASFGVDEIYGKIDFGNRNWDDRICSIVAAQEAACDSVVSSNGYLAFHTEARSENISEKMRITSTGQVGVGTDTPHGYLHLATGPRTSLGRLNSDAIATKVTLATPADIVDFYDGMKVTFSSSSGGTGSPVTTTISSTDKDPESGDYGTFNVAATTDIDPQDYCTTPLEDNYLRFTTEITGHDADDGAFIGIAAANYMDIKTKNTDMYLSAGSGYAPVWIKNSGEIRFHYAPYFVNGLYINSVDDSKKIDDGPNGGSSTQMYIGNVNINPTSDRRIKKNIVDTSANALETLDKVRVVDFEWDDPVDTSWNGKNARGLWTGVIAQEVIEHIPYAVNAPRDPQTMETLPDAKKLDENGNEIDELWFMNHGDIVPLLIKAVQELKSEIAQLKEGN